MRAKFAILGLILLLVVAACGGNEDADNSEAMVPNPANIDAAPVAESFNDPAQQPADTIANQIRLIIQNATLNLIVEDVETKVSEIRDIADQHGGWIVGSNTSSRIAFDDVSYGYGSIAFRVPADRFDDTLVAIKVDGVIQVNSENITGEDVTERYVDLNSRLRSKQTSYDQLAVLMESATDVDDVLAVQAQLERFQTDIEVLEGQIRYLEESAAFSLITVELSEEVPQRPDVEDEDEEDDPWKPVQTAKDAFNALIALLQWLGDVLIVIVVFVLPLSLIIGIPTWAVYRLVQRYLPSGKPLPSATINPQPDDPNED